MITTVDRKDMDDTVLVIAGEWECLNGGRWHFKVSQNTYVKWVAVKTSDSYDEFAKMVGDMFGMDIKTEKAQLTYWCEGETEVFTHVKMPPVSVDSESAFRRFVKKFVLNPGLNLYLTVPVIRSSEVAVSSVVVEDGSKEYVECEEIRLAECGQNVPIETVVAAVAEEEAVHRRNLMLFTDGQSKEGAKGTQETIEDVEIMAEVAAIEGVYAKDDRGTSHGGRPLGSSSSVSDGESSEEYDFDAMTELIDK